MKGEKKKRETKKFGACHINYYGVTKKNQVTSQGLICTHSLETFAGMTYK